MKKTYLLIIFILLAIVNLNLVLSSLDISDITLGSDTQERAKNTTTTINIKNIGDSKLSLLSLSFNGDSKYNLKYNLSKSEINPNETIQLTIQGYVPLDFDAVNSKGKKTSFKISDFTISGKYQNNSDYSITRSLFMQAENKLRITTGSKILINDEEKTLRNERSYDIKRSDKIELKIELENRFSTSGDCEKDSSDCAIDDIELTLESRNSDLDVEKDISYSKLNPNKKSSKSITFTIPDDLDEDEYTLDIWLIGEDENGALHGDYWEFTLNLELPDDEVSITNVNLFPEELNCNERNFRLDVSIKNTGKDDQDEVSIWVDSTKLDIMDSIENILLDENEKTTKSFFLKTPTNIKPGIYPILVRANVNNDDETDREVVYLKINPCNTTQTQPTQQNNQQTNITNNQNTNNQNQDSNVIEIPPTQIIYGTEKSNFFESKEFIYILIGFIVISVILLLILVAILAKR
ncbi:MAG: hypothetical protein QXE31_06185 [Candidatus Woesearchaeota archaeon]